MDSVNLFTALLFNFSKVFVLFSVLRGIVFLFVEFLGKYCEKT